MLARPHGGFLVIVTMVVERNRRPDLTRTVGTGPWRHMELLALLGLSILLKFWMFKISDTSKWKHEVVLQGVWF